jgi:hypothetical protein
MALLWQTHKAFCGRANHSRSPNPDLRVLEKGRFARMMFSGNRYPFPHPCAKGRDGKSGQIANARYIATVGLRNKSQSVLL